MMMMIIIIIIIINNNNNKQHYDQLTANIQVDLYTHGLQTATRAYRAGEETDMIVAARMHER